MRVTLDSGQCLVPQWPPAFSHMYWMILHSHCINLMQKSLKSGSRPGPHQEKYTGKSSPQYPCILEMCHVRIRTVEGKAPQLKILIPTGY